MVSVGYIGKDNVTYFTEESFYEEGYVVGRSNVKIEKM